MVGLRLREVERAQISRSFYIKSYLGTLNLELCTCTSRKGTRTASLDEEKPAGRLQLVDTPTLDPPNLGTDFQIPKVLLILKAAIEILLAMFLWRSTAATKREEKHDESFGEGHLGIQ